MHISTPFKSLLAQLLLIALSLSSCAHVAERGEPPAQQVAAAPAEVGILAEITSSFSAGHGPEYSGFHLLDRSADALTWRLALLDSAQASLDILYYLWHDDTAGRLVMHRLLLAADRGVKIRLLVDDLSIIGKDDRLVALDGHPNLQLRLFNPKYQRMVGMAADTLLRFERMNARMHNKLILADGHAVILGGRNIGDSYFGLSDEFNFHDLDVLGIGPVAQDASGLFDNFWNSLWSVPASRLPAQAEEGELMQHRTRFVEFLQNSDRLTQFKLEPIDWSEQLTNLAANMHPGTAEVLYDRMDGNGIDQEMVEPLGGVIRSAKETIRITNPYFVPNDNFLSGVSQVEEQGVAVKILTNSLAAQDLPAVNSHYKKWRKPLVNAGVSLFEMRSDPANKANIHTEPVSSKHSGLHAKTFVVDGERTFIGSFNLDPRSADINTEMGVVIDSPGLGREMVRIFKRDTSPENAWRVSLDEKGRLTWTNDDEAVTRQPARGFWQRVQDFFYILIPVSQI